MYSAMFFVDAPGVNNSPTPITLSFSISSSGIIPPPVNKTSSKLWKSHLSNNIGNVYYHSGDIEQAISSYGDALNYNESLIFYLNLCYSYLLKDANQATLFLNNSLKYLSKHYTSYSVKLVDIRLCMSFLKYININHSYLFDDDISIQICNIGRQYDNFF